MKGRPPTKAAPVKKLSSGPQNKHEAAAGTFPSALSSTTVHVKQGPPLPVFYVVAAVSL